MTPKKKKFRAFRPRTMVVRPFWTQFCSLPASKDDRGCYEAGWNDPACDYTLSGNADLRLAPDNTVWMMVCHLNELPDRSEVLPEGQDDGIFTLPEDCKVCGHTVEPCAMAETPCGKVVHEEECFKEHVDGCGDCHAFLARVAELNGAAA